VVFFTLMKPQEIGTVIARRRKSLRVNQRELAMLCGVSEHALCNLERGNGNPTIGLLGTVADALGMELKISVKDMELS